MATSDTMQPIASDLMARLEREFTTEEQGLFLKSFSAYLHHGPTDFVVDLDDVWEWVGFAEKGKAKRLIVKHFSENKDYLSACPEGQANTGRGGHNKASILMSVRSFKRFCMVAKTGKADTVREYYLTMEEVLMGYLKDREADSVRQLMDAHAANAIEINRITANSEMLVSQQLHDTLVAANRGQPLMYIGSLIWQGVRYHKVGGTDDIHPRGHQLPQEFNKTFRFVWVYPSKSWRNIERKVKHLESIQQFKLGVPKRDGSLSTETFVSTDEFNTETLIAHIKLIAARVASEGPNDAERKADLAVLQAHNEQDRLMIEKTRVEHEHVRLCQDAALQNRTVTALTATLDRFAAKLCEDTRNTVLGAACTSVASALTMALGDRSVDAVTNDSIEKPNAEQTVPTYNKPRKNGRGLAIQRYSIVLVDGKDTFVFEESYSGQTEATRRMDTIEGLLLCANGINKACVRSAAYGGFRWAKVDPLDRDVAQELQPTTSTIRVKTSMMAMIMLDKTCVARVFADQLDAATSRDVTSPSITKAVKRGTKSTGFYWKRWCDVDPMMREQYLETNELPDPKITSASNSILIFDPTSGQKVDTFKSTQEAVRKMQVSRLSIANTIDFGLPMKGYVWRWA